MSSDKRQATSDKQQISARFVLPVACCLSLVLTGCVRQSLTIKTDPPGAMVYVNDQLKGASPVTYDFMWYGWHRLTLRKDGFERLDDRRQLRAPVYLWIPFDLVMELLPFSIRDARVWSYTLTPAPALPTPQPPSPSASTQSGPGSSGTAAEPPSPGGIQPPQAPAHTTEPTHDPAG